MRAPFLDPTNGFSLFDDTRRRRKKKEKEEEEEEEGKGGGGRDPNFTVAQSFGLEPDGKTREDDIGGGREGGMPFGFGGEEKQGASC